MLGVTITSSDALDTHPATLGASCSCSRPESYTQTFNFCICLIPFVPPTYGTVIDPELVGRKVPRKEKKLYCGTGPESYITDYTLVYEDQRHHTRQVRVGEWAGKAA